MMDKNEKFENIEQLIDNLFGSESEKVKSDIAAGDKLMKNIDISIPAGVADEIKEQIRGKLERQKRVFLPRLLLKTAAVAAIIIAGFMLLNYTDLKTEEIQVAQQSPEYVWEEFDADTDTEIATLAMAIEDVANEMISLRLDEENGNGSSAGMIDEFELEVIETETVFWKG